MNKEQLTTRLNELTAKLNRLAVYTHKLHGEVEALAHEVSITPAPATRRDTAVDQTARPDTTFTTFTVRFIRNEPRS